MKVNSQLERAQWENLASAPTVGTTGRFYWDTVLLRSYLDDGTTWRALLRNDGKAIIGNSGTAADNTRFHRGAAGVLQLVPGSDTTTEGTLSTSLNQLSTRFENYTDAGKPTFGNAGRIIWVTDLKTFLGDSGTAWVQVGGGALFVTGSTGTPQNIVAGTGIVYVETSGPRQLWFVATAVGEVILTAIPQITAATIVGKELWLVGTSNDNYPTFHNGDGLALRGDWSGLLNSILKLVWDGTNWLETGRI